ncbi:sigma-54 dependent transcriptional regulator [Desulfovibrio mangrovi]|uniref:sigma-54-dependent transcriptional regulator n=1 Tax=Desulfovibrio mangrovi TaxID=2976983 RepID=UPI00224508D1|nr:sigma-54 dependent transcriptional regulator [Desulfovibrio mangrovi]UZP68325.1 sigma-54 dependent transcriptional regulator [Desulfovibrio mangrovi]
MSRIVIVDDELMVRTMLGDVAESMDHEVHAAPDISGGLALARETGCDIVYLDVLLPDGNGLEHLSAFKQLPSQPEIIVITSFGDPDGAELAVRHGVWDYLQKPLVVDQVKLSLARALAFRQQKENANNLKAFSRPEIIGNSPALQQAISLAKEAASTSVNVLLQGETGTGKELFARAIHQNSPRSARPFVTLDCASITESLLESQLFGHVKGSFTGADRSREGLLKLAHGGTLFLDEIGDLPLHIQGAFLRALETKRFRPLGATLELESDFRLIAATNKDLHEMVRLDMFRADLLYRLRGMTITLPPLRERQEDLPLLIGHYLDKHCTRYGVCNKVPSDDFLEAIATYDWPGNIRELVHALDRACTASIDDPVLFARQLPTEIRVQVARTATGRNGNSSTSQVMRPVSPTPSAQLSEVMSPIAPPQAPPTLKEHRQLTEFQYLQDVLRHVSGNIPAAVEITGVSRGHLYELLKKHGITP